MAKCDLRIELEPGTSTWRMGEVVRGAVVVATDGDVKCGGLDVEVTWSTHGKGNRARGEAQKVRLFEGEWTGATERRYPFELMLPAHGPRTYNGHYLNVGWFVHATADIPWKIDPKTEIELAVEPDPEIEPDWTAQFENPYQIPKELRDEALAGEAGRTVRQEASGCGKVFGWIVGLGCLGILLAFLVLGGGVLWTSIEELRLVLAGERGWLDAIVPLIFLGIGVFVLGGIVFGIVSTVLRRKKLGEVRLAIEPRVVAPGGEVRVAISGQPPSALQLNRATVRLRAREEVVRGSGTNRTTYRHDVHDETIEIGVTRPLAARIPFQIEGTVRIPETAPPSFGASSNQLQWSVDVEMDIARCPDWSESEAIVVTPPR